MRIPIATDLKTRTTAPESKDARMKNSYAEIRGEQSAVRKRPIAQGGVTTLAGQAQGGIGINIAGTDYIYTFNGDVSALNVVSFGTTWASGTTYAIGDVVSSGFVNYWATTAHTNSSPPSANWSTTYVPSLAKTYATWSAAKKNAAVTLSNGNLTASVAEADARGVRTTTVKSSGKWYWEITVDAYDSGNNSMAFGTTYSGLNGFYPDMAESFSYAALFPNTSWAATNGSYVAYGAHYVAGDIIGVALNADTGAISFFKNGTAHGNAFSSAWGTVQNEATFSVAANNTTPTTVTANFGASAFAYSVPSGFNAGLYT